MKTFTGKVLFLDRSDINTDEIIPARYLNGDTKELLKPHLFEDFKLAGFTPGVSTDGASVIVTRANFGCGSSREHAPWALEVNGINIVIAESFARIFRQNMYNCGMIAAELPPDTIGALFQNYAGNGKTETELDLANNAIRFKSARKETTVPFTLAGFDRALVEAGGWVDYAAGKY
jgi:3-isopropylmalate/(R)-2-methylmalate dehydratase small subunit